ncbi:hypothetical protein E1B28_010958 [Marasmius oreades]|uniref:C2H2-type domain-containing protein n=1 Tax=Marasmius oreades TaxID=181124 RepID=A0A9P7RTU1_9AGAR|nr:uncharacterized protein E1B28_010958 [Marasmius oreades]KAG7089260.1 hypothetical protein E1B28_010958 [Marasmius oreades]
MANSNTFSGYSWDFSGREAHKQPEAIDHTFGMGRGQPKRIHESGDGDLATHGLASLSQSSDVDHFLHEDAYPQGQVDCRLHKEDRFDSVQDYNSFSPSPIPVTPSNQHPETVATPQYSHSNSIVAVSNIPPNAPPVSRPSVFSQSCHPCRSLSSSSGDFIYSTADPDEGHLERCYHRLPTALYDTRSHEYGIQLPGSYTTLADGRLITLTTPADNAAVQRAFVAPPAVVEAAISRRTPGRPTPHVCRFCDARFTAGHNLKNHIHSHLGVRPYPCKGCQRGFVTKHDRRRHEKTCRDIPHHSSPFS